MKFKVKHKTQGWTGTLDLDFVMQTSFASHSATLQFIGYLVQDSRTPQGDYVEDPEIESLDDLELTPIKEGK